VNLYAYAGNNPIAYDDPFGLMGCTQQDYKDCKIWTFSGGAQAGLKIHFSVGPLHGTAGVSAGVVHETTVTASLHVEHDTRVEGSGAVRVGGVGPEVTASHSLTTGQNDLSGSLSAVAENKKGDEAAGGVSTSGDISLSGTVGYATFGVTFHLHDAATATVGAVRDLLHGIGSYLSGSEKSPVEQAPTTNPFGIRF